MREFVLPSLSDGNVCIPLTRPLPSDSSPENVLWCVSLYFGALSPDCEGLSARVISMPGIPNLGISCA